MSLTVEITGTGTVNRGAELMAIAIATALREELPHIRLVVPPKFGDFEARSCERFWTTWEFQNRFGLGLAPILLRTAPNAIRKTLGVLDPRSIDAVVDASGFAFSDQWGPQFANALFSKLNSAARKNSPLILLPQAFGPFCRKDVSKATRALCQRASRIYARDQISFESLLDIGVDESRLRKSPDFTIGIPPIIDNQVKLPCKKFCAIVPNVRMTDKTDKAKEYWNFLSDAIKTIDRHGYQPVIVLHTTGQDTGIARQLGNTVSNLCIIEHKNPQVLKHVLGSAHLVISSRFHAIVSTLSQGTPCIGTGWSHKYEELYRDFDCSELLLHDLSQPEQLSSIIESMKEDSVRLAITRKLSKATDRLKEANSIMWQDVVEIIKQAN